MGMGEHLDTAYILAIYETIKLILARIVSTRDQFQIQHKILLAVERLAIIMAALADKLGVKFEEPKKSKEGDK